MTKKNYQQKDNDKDKYNDKDKDKDNDIYDIQRTPSNSPRDL